MASQVINDLEPLDSVRGKLNSMFSELYSAIPSGGSGGSVSSSNPIFNSLDDIAAANIPSVAAGGPKAIMTIGRFNTDDGGGGIYSRVIGDITAVSGEVIASSYAGVGTSTSPAYTGLVGSGLRDGDDDSNSTVWGTQTAGGGSITADLGSIQSIAAISVLPIPSTFDNWGGVYTNGGLVSWSTDNIDFTDVGVLSGASDGVPARLAINASCRYIKIERTDNYLGIADFRMYASATFVAPRGGTLSADQQAWGLVPINGDINVLQFGAKPDYATLATPNWQAFEDAKLYAAARWPASPQITIPPGKYWLEDTWEIKGGALRIRGFSTSRDVTNRASELVFPADKWGIIVARSNTHLDGLSSDDLGGGDGAIISGLAITSLSGGNRADGSYNGIWLRAHAVLLDILVDGFPDHGIHIYAQESGGPTNIGNANIWFLNRFSSVNNGGDGLHVRGDCANAGTALNGSVYNNRGWGYRDRSFGNYFIGIESTSNGKHGDVIAVYGGGNYTCVPGQEAAASTTVPGTDPTVWMLWYTGAPFGDTSTWRTWTSGLTWLSGGAYCNGWSHFSYTEGNQPPAHVEYGWSSTSMGLQGAGFTVRSFGAIERNGSYLAGVYGNDGIVSAFLGGGGTTGVIVGANSLESGSKFENRIISLRMDLTNGNIALDDNYGNNTYYTITGPNTTDAWGNAAAIPFAFRPNRLRLYNYDHVAHAPEVFYVNAIPSTSGYCVGSIAFHADGTSGQPFAWKCSATGSPDTWIPLGNIP